MECDRVLLGSCLIICDIIEKQNFQPGEPASPWIYPNFSTGYIYTLYYLLW